LLSKTLSYKLIPSRRLKALNLNVLFILIVLLLNVVEIMMSLLREKDYKKQTFLAELTKKIRL
jgi:hypothetical protein